MPEHNAYKKYMDSPHKTRGEAIKAMCAHCMGCTYDHMEEGYRTLVRECASTSCPLHNFRPWRDKTDGADDQSGESPDELIPLAAG